MARRPKTRAAIRTKRLVLRPLRPDDAARIAAFACDWDVATMTARVSYPYPSANAGYWIDDLAPGEVTFGIEYEGALVGVCGHSPGDDGDTAEIGYWIGRPWWNRGLATEAATALVAHCFRATRCRRIVCRHFVGNAASARVIRKLGFRQTGTGVCWCEARRADVATVEYERARPSLADWWRRAA